MPRPPVPKKLAKASLLSVGFSVVVLSSLLGVVLGLVAGFFRGADKVVSRLIDAMMAHPILINRPFVVTPMGTRLCRPSEVVLDILPPVSGPFTKEDDEVVIDSTGNRPRSIHPSD